MCSTYSKANILKELKLRFMAERVFVRRQVPICDGECNVWNGIVLQVRSVSPLLREIDAFTSGAARRKLMVLPRSMQNDHSVPLARRALQTTR